MTQEIFKKNHDGTFQWRSNKVKNIFDDFSGKVDDRIIHGKAGDHRTQVITFKPNDSTNTIEIVGVNKSIEIDYKNRKKVDIEYIELRGGLDSKDEQILICNSILYDRLSKTGVPVKITKEKKRTWKNGKYVYE